MSKPHETRFLPGLNAGLGADVDVQVISLVESFNGLGLTTISSCQGDPGIIGEGGSYGHISFYRSQDRQAEYEELSRFTFGFLREMFGHLYDDVILSVHLSEQTGFYGWMSFRNEAIENISLRLSVYCDMRHR